MVKNKNVLMVLIVSTISFTLTPTSKAAISLDRTRVVFPGPVQSVTLDVFNKDEHNSYQTQVWLEDAQGNKLNDKSAFIVIPSEQIVVPKGRINLKIKAMPTTSLLPQDKETLFYLNILEIPPKNDKPNTIQIKLQTRIKMFYRPEMLMQGKHTHAFQEKIILNKDGTSYIASNPTPFFITLIDSNLVKGKDAVKSFESVVIPPKSSAKIGGVLSASVTTPILFYVNDYGERITLNFHCNETICKVDGNELGK